MSEKIALQTERAWLIRYPDFSFSRPIPESELKRKFKEGEMQPKEEICPGDGYWFSLQDVKEMRKHFGGMPLDGLFKKINDEVTQERFEVTASFQAPVKQVTSTAIVQPKPQAVIHPPVVPIPVSFEEETPAKMSVTLKALLVILALLVGISIFVWFD